MYKKYELTDETKELNDHILHRIRALENFGNVKAGDLGGYIQSEHNLSQGGYCWVYYPACVFENARINLDAKIYGTSMISGHATITDLAMVFGDCHIWGDALITRKTKIYGKAIIYGNAIINGNAIIYAKNEMRIGGKTRIDMQGFINSSRDFICIGPAGYRDDFVTFYKTRTDDIFVSTGYFNGNLKEFTARVKACYKEKNPFYYDEYLRASKFAVDWLTRKPDELAKSAS